MVRGTRQVLSAAVAVAAILAVASGFPNGAPGKDCWTDRPLHGNYLPAHLPPPYQIVLSKLDPKADNDTYSPGEMINVTIQSRDGTPFKGYLMKVYSSNGVSRGIWGAKKGEQHVLKRCGVTHDKNTSITAATILWVAPKMPVMDNIQFKAIIVKDFTVFYNNVLSRPLKPNYPTLSFDRLFQRLVALANKSFNVSVPTIPIPLPDPSIMSLLGPPPSSSAVKGVSKVTNSQVKAVVGAGSGTASTSVVPAVTFPV